MVCLHVAILVRLMLLALKPVTTQFYHLLRLYFVLDQPWTSSVLALIK